MTYLEPNAGWQSSEQNGSGAMAGSSTPTETSATSKQVRVHTILKARRGRSKFFDAKLFADPVWDMLLELYAAYLSQFDLSVSSLCLGSAVPATTALRWMNAMEDRGLLERRSDPRDRRRVLVNLTDTAAKKMDLLFERVTPFETLI